MFLQKLRLKICENYLKYLGFSKGQINTLFLCKGISKNKTRLKLSKEYIEDGFIDFLFIPRDLVYSYDDKNKNYLIEEVV